MITATAAAAKTEQIFIFGGREILIFASTIASHSLAVLLRAHRVGTVVGFIDNNRALHGQDALGLPVLSPAGAAAKHPGALVILCLAWNSMPPARAQCEELGLECVTPEECWRQLVAPGYTDAL